MNEIYKSDGHTIYGKKTAKGIDYLEFGSIGDPLVVYLHGIVRRTAVKAKCAGFGIIVDHHTLPYKVGYCYFNGDQETMARKTAVVY